MKRCRVRRSGAAKARRKTRKAPILQPRAYARGAAGRIVPGGAAERGVPLLKSH